MSVDLFAGIPVADYAAALTWYEHLLGSPPTFFPNSPEAVWELADHRFLYIGLRPEHAGHAMHTLFVADFDARMDGIAARGLEPAMQETYSNGVRKTTYRDRRGERDRVRGCTRPTAGQPPVSSVGTLMTSTIAPRRYTVIGSGRLIASANSSRCRLCASATGRRPASSTRSPDFSPDRSAGPPATTSMIRSPRRRPVRPASGAGRGAGVLTKPRRARRTRPSVTSASTIRRLVSLIGTASPRPHPATAVLMPTTRDEESASAPPELPGLSAASVWMTSSTTRAVRPSRVGRERPSPLTTPAVTEPARPSGLPTATTSWPTRSPEASPSSAGGGVAERARTTARSVNGSAPTTSTSASPPSLKTARPRVAPATTCALVSSSPSSVNTTADPPPRPPGPATSSAATCGVRSPATAVTMRE